MKKLFLLLFIIVILITCIAQDEFIYGYRVGLDTTNIVVDSIDKVGNYLILYIDGDSYYTMLDSADLSLNSITIDTLYIIDVSGVDSLRIYDDGDTTRLVSDNPIKIGPGSLVIETGGDVSMSDDLSVTGTITNTELQTATSTTSTNATSVNTLDNNTEGTQGYELIFSGDSMIVVFGGDTMSFVQSSGVETDITAPTVLAIELGNYAGDTVIVTFSENMDTDSIPAMSSLTFTEDGVTYGLDQAYFNNADSLYIPLDSAGTSEVLYLLSYTRPGLADYQDPADNKLQSFSDMTVVNNISCASDTVLAHYRFENDPTDETGDYDLTANGGATYDAGEKVEGSYGGDVNGSNRYFGIPSIPYTNTFTISMWFKEYWAVLADRVLFTTLQSDDGIEISIYGDGSTGQVRVKTGNGSTTELALSNTGLSLSAAFHHVVVVVDVTAGSCVIYYDNSEVTSTSTIHTGMETTSIGRLGLDFDSSGDLFGYVDGFQFYDVALSASEVSDLYNTPASSIVVANCGDPPIPSDSITVYWSEDWNDFNTTSTTSATAPTGITRSAFETNLENYKNLQSETYDDNDLANNVDIVSYGESNVLKSWYPEGQCCTGGANEGAYSNGGT
ncbi:hypothetical protein LCGC14_1713250, partial [marine sediment metagenome]